MKICYHHNDLDGICSAAIVRKYHPDVKCIPCQYGREIKIPEEIADHIFMVDFSDKYIIEKFSSLTNFTWIDHHKTAQEDLSDLWNDENIKGTRSTDKAACELTWEYFYPSEATPVPVLYIGDFDMWEFEHVHTKKFFETAQVILDSPVSPSWDKLLSDESNPLVKEYIDIGSYLVKAKTKRYQVSFSNGYDIKWHGYKTRVINTNNDISDAGAYAKERGYDVAIIWYNYKNQIRVGLRCKDEIDVSIIAKQYGGGGHKNAAGFIQSPKEFFEMVNII